MLLIRRRLATFGELPQLDNCANVPWDLRFPSVWSLLTDILLGRTVIAALTARDHAVHRRRTRNAENSSAECRISR